MYKCMNYAIIAVLFQFLPWEMANKLYKYLLIPKFSFTKRLNWMDHHEILTKHMPLHTFRITSRLYSLTIILLVLIPKHGPNITSRLTWLGSDNVKNFWFAKAGSFNTTLLAKEWLTLLELGGGTLCPPYRKFLFSPIFK